MSATKHGGGEALDVRSIYLADGESESGLVFVVTGPLGACVHIPITIDKRNGMLIELARNVGRERR